MTINLPKDWTAVTVRQYQALQSIFANKEADVYAKNLAIISALSGVKVDDLHGLSLKSYTKVMNVLGYLNEEIENKLTRKFKLNGKRYKMFTDLYELNGGQYITLMHLLKEQDATVANLHQIMAVFCAPWRKRFLWVGEYKYTGDDFEQIAKEMLDLPVSVAYPLANFFLFNSAKLEKATLESSVSKLKKLMREKKSARTKAVSDG